MSQIPLDEDRGRGPHSTGGSSQGKSGKAAGGGASQTLAGGAAGATGRLQVASWVEGLVAGRLHVLSHNVRTLGITDTATYSKQTGHGEVGCGVRAGVGHSP